MLSLPREHSKAPYIIHPNVVPPPKFWIQWPCLPITKPLYNPNLPARNLLHIISQLCSANFSSLDRNTAKPSTGSILLSLSWLSWINGTSCKMMEPLMLMEFSR
jgi:hypothetical protein